MSDDRHVKLLITFGVFMILLNFPMLAIVDVPERWFGVPALYFYLFSVWAVLIFVIARVVRKKK